MCKKVIDFNRISQMNIWTCLIVSHFSSMCRSWTGSSDPWMTFPQEKMHWKHILINWPLSSETRYTRPHWSARIKYGLQITLTKYCHASPKAINNGCCYSFLLQDYSVCAWEVVRKELVHVLKVTLEHHSVKLFWVILCILFIYYYYLFIYLFFIYLFIYHYLLYIMYYVLFIYLFIHSFIFLFFYYLYIYIYDWFGNLCIYDDNTIKLNTLKFISLSITYV